MVRSALSAVLQPTRNVSDDCEMCTQSCKMVCVQAWRYSSGGELVTRAMAVSSNEGMGCFRGQLYVQRSRSQKLDPFRSVHLVRVGP
nr:hypothetical protein CFP56_69059 [Quercus suber]